MACAVCRTFWVSITYDNPMHLKLMTYYYYSSYALWLSGQNIPNNGSGYANLTNWFKIEGGQENASIGFGQSLSFGQIAGVVVGITIAISLIAAAVFVFQRRSLQKTPRVSLVETPSRKSFSSITDEKAAARLAMSQVDV